MQAMQSEITKAVVAELERSDFINGLFGLMFPMIIEPAIFAFASRLSSEYQGGYWQFYTLGNGSFYMAPDGDVFPVTSENGYTGEMSGDALGLCACLYAFSHLSFSDREELAKLCGDHYRLLYDYVFDHPESATILRLID